MSTLLAQTVTAAMAVLQAAPAVCSQVDRIRLRPVALDTAQAVVVRAAACAADDVALFSGQPISWTTELTVECYARTTGHDPDAVIDPLIEAVYTRLMTDPTLGGAVLALVPKQVQIDFEATADKAACATLIFYARHRASAGSFS